MSPPQPPPAQQVFDFHARLAASPGAAERLLATLDACGIGMAAVAAGGVIELRRLSRQLVVGGHVESDAPNEAVAVACAGSGGRLVPFYFANPHRGPGPYLASGEGFVGLELSPAVHGVGLADERTTELVEVARRLRHPVYVACLARPGSGVADLVALAARFDDVTFVLGHSGVGNIDFYGLELVARQPNVAVETSGGYTTVVRAALDLLGPGRVLFGSEYPLQHPSVELAKFAALDLAGGDWRQVAWDNACRILERSEYGAHDRAPAVVG